MNSTFFWPFKKKKQFRFDTKSQKFPRHGFPPFSKRIQNSGIKQLREEFQKYIFLTFQSLPPFYL